MDNTRSILIEDISKKYGEQVALSDINFSMQKGEVIGLLGVNGAGKSTLMKILSGNIIPDKGRVTYFGKEFLSSPQLIKKQIGYLSEDNPLYEDMYVKEYLEYVAGIYKCEKNSIPRVIEQVGLQHEYKKKIKALSKGNRQRVGISQALIHDPLFLILDESTAGLDPNQRDSINNLFVELSKEKIILFSTHHLQEVKDICSRILILEKGKLLVDKNMEDIESVENIFHAFTNENNS